MLPTSSVGREVSIGIAFSSVLTLLALFAGACGSPSSPQAVPHEQSDVTLNIGFPYVAGEDPLRGIQQAARLISQEGLLGTSRDGRPQGRLAESWSEATDGRSWRFKLRENAFFHDGTSVDSTAVRLSLERSIARADSTQYPGLADITSIETPSPHEVIIRVRDRSTFLLDDLGVAILKSAPGQTQIGAGPYVPVSSDKTESIMAAFPKYYRGTPEIDRVVWKAFPTVRTAWAAMMRGEVDFLYEVGEDAREFIQAESSTQVYPFLRNYLYTVAFNHRRSVFRDKRIRTALNLAIDRSAVIQLAFRGHGRQASVPAWPEHWAYDASVPSYEYNPLRAIALLDAALPARQQSPNQSGRLQFTCLIPENFALWERIGLLVQRDLAEIGVDMRLEAVPADLFNQRIGKGDFDAVLLELIVGNTATRSFTFWHSQSGQNAWGYSNPALDLALDRMRRAEDDIRFREGFRSFQIESLDDAPAIFVALAETTRAVSRRFEVIAPAGSDILPTISDWRLAAGARQSD